MQHSLLLSKVRIQRSLTGPGHLQSCNAGPWNCFKRAMRQSCIRCPPLFLGNSTGMPGTCCRQLALPVSCSATLSTPGTGTPHPRNAAGVLHVCHSALLIPILSPAGSERGIGPGAVLARLSLSPSGACSSRWRRGSGTTAGGLSTSEVHLAVALQSDAAGIGGWGALS